VRQRCPGPIGDCGNIDHGEARGCAPGEVMAELELNVGQTLGNAPRAAPAKSGKYEFGTELFLLLPNIEALKFQSDDLHWISRMNAFPGHAFTFAQLLGRWPSLCAATSYVAMRHLL
jgi:hypothetical protein